MYTENDVKLKLSLPVVRCLPILSSDKHLNEKSTCFGMVILGNFGFDLKMTSSGRQWFDKNGQK